MRCPFTLSKPLDAFILGNGGGAMPQEMQDKQKAKAIKQALKFFFSHNNLRKCRIPDNIQHSIFTKTHLE